MKSKHFRFQIPILVVVVLCFSSAECYGYIEPSTGYVLWQILAGGFLGALFFAKKCFRFFKRPDINSKLPEHSTES